MGYFPWQLMSALHVLCRELSIVIAAILGILNKFAKAFGRIHKPSRGVNGLHPSFY
jgi:hypothetical protein